MNEARNATVKYERTDVNARAVIWFTTGLVVALVIVMILLVVLYTRLEYATLRSQRANSLVIAERAKQRQESPDKLLPPRPRLDGLGPLPQGREIGRIQPEPPAFPRSPAHDDVNDWRWSDSAHTAACIPVSEAMNRLLKNPGDHLKARSEKRPADDRKKEGGDT